MSEKHVTEKYPTLFAFLSLCTSNGINQDQLEKVLKTFPIAIQFQIFLEGETGREEIDAYFHQSEKELTPEEEANVEKILKSIKK